MVPLNGRAPDRHSYRITPRAHTSAGGPRNLARPAACSGAMYDGVPMSVCVRVRSVACHFARPKSATFGVPSAASSTLPGFRSRWTMPRSCAAATPRATFSTSSAAARGDMRGPPSRSESDPPVTSSIAMNGHPAWSPISKICTTFGCLTAAIASASPQNRASAAREAPPRRSVLIATSRFSALWRARYTTPIPPCPSSDRIT